MVDYRIGARNIQDKPGKKESDKKGLGMLKGHRNQSEEAPMAKTGLI